MPSASLLITSIPDGEAPLWVREQWVGLSLPLAHLRAGARLALTFGVLSGPATRWRRIAWLLTGRFKLKRGFMVDSRAAVGILASKSPQAAAWWREHAGDKLKPGLCFVFAETSARITVAD